MKCFKSRVLLAIAVAILGQVAASSSLALSVNPYNVDLTDIYALGNSTDANNLSTIDAINVLPNGIQLDVTWRIGQQADPFAPNFGQTFARIGLSRFTNGEDGGLGRLMDAYDGIRWTVSSDTGNDNAQPFTQTAPNWTFYESNYGQPVPTGIVPTAITLDFDAAVNFSGLMPANIVHPDGNGEIRMNALGLQIVGPSGLVLGQPVQGKVWITGVPEPASAMLLVLGAVGVAGVARRRRS